MAGSVEGEEFFSPDESAVAIYRALAAPLVAREDVAVRVTKSQVAFRARRAFAFAWAPGRYVRSVVPVVVSFALRQPLSSPRFKEVAHSSARVWMHHVELKTVDDVDEEVRAWLSAAYAEAR